MGDKGLAGQPASDRPADDLRIAFLPPAACFELRLHQRHLEAVDRALGFAMPRMIGMTRRDAELQIFCLGPDEWRLKGPALASRLAAAFPSIDVPCPHSLIDITHRDLEIAVGGWHALDLLAGGCPLDLERMAVGRVARSVFAAAEIVLFRRDETIFELAVARSFAPYVHGLLQKIARESSQSSSRSRHSSNVSL
jgi:sarcosine oxidase subunit gamma